MLEFKETTKTYTKEEALEEAKRCLNCKKPFCQNGCPAHLRTNEFIQAIKNDDLALAYKLIMEGTNLSPICSRVCNHYDQCIGNCILNKAKKEPIKVGYLERYVLDNYQGELEQEMLRRDVKIGIIGSGPAGLSCALELVKNGVEAHVYEKDEHLGGILSYGIPEYRLPKALVNKYIDFLKRMGVKFYNNNPKTVEELKKAGYNKVFVGCGLGKYNKMRIPGEDLDGVIDGGTFLRKVNLKEGFNEGEGYKLEGITYVVGAGNVAMDCARCSQRVGSNQTVVVYRRTLDEAPASKEEIRDAKEEGVLFNFLHNPVEVIGENGKVKAIKCEIMELGEEDSSGRRRPVGTGKYETFECDNVLVAIGQSPDDSLNEVFSLNTDHGYIVSSDGISTSDEDVLAGGDIVRGADTVVGAMVDGKNAAKKILELLK